MTNPSVTANSTATATAKATATVVTAKVVIHLCTNRQFVVMTAIHSKKKDSEKPLKSFYNELEKIEDRDDLLSADSVFCNYAL